MTHALEFLSEKELKIIIFTMLTSLMKIAEST